MGDLFLTSWCRIKRGAVVADNNSLFELQDVSFDVFIEGLYRKLGTDYAKFAKMDNQSKLGLMASEVLLKNRPLTKLYNQEEIAIVLSNSEASFDTDKNYLSTIANEQDYFPSPALFVYTLSNIVGGEICIRHKIKGENTFFVSENFNTDLLQFYVNALINYSVTEACIGGWVNFSENVYDAFLFAVERENEGEGKKFNSSLLKQLYNLS